MDLSAPIGYNGFTASGLTPQAGGKPSVGTVFDRVDISDIDTDGYLEKRALHDGLNATDVFEGGRRVAIDAAMYGSTKAHGWDQLQAFLRAYNPRIAFNDNSGSLGFANMTFQQPTISTGVWTAGYIPMYMGLRPLRPVRYVIERQQTGGKEGQGLSFRANALLIAKDPRKYAQTATSATVQTTTSTATNNGDYPTFPIISWTMTAVGAANLTFTVGGASIVINMSAQSSGDWTLNYDTHQLVLLGIVRPELIVSAGAWNEILPGSVTTFSAANVTGLSGGGSPTLITYHDAWA